MIVWSTLRPLLTRFKSSAMAIAKRNMSEHRTFPLQPTRYHWIKFKDLLHLYVCVGVIPAGLLVLYTNIFIGPATLSEIPEGYEPKHWEYYPHPITRFIARYILQSPQEDYEKMLHIIYEEDEKRRLRMLEKKVKEKMQERGDYQAYYYRPTLAKYHRVMKESADINKSLQGD